MPLICGPKNSRYTFTGSPCPHLDLAIEVVAGNLDDALRAYESHFHVAISPFIGTHGCLEAGEPRYFEFTDVESDRMQLVDIHVHRNGIDLCPKQNLAFALLSGDLVEIGELIC